MSDLSKINTNEVSEELKNKIRIERALEAIENHRDITYRVYDTYYKTRKELSLENIKNYPYSLGIKASLRDIKEDAIDDFKNEADKRHCLYFLIQVLYVDIDTLKSFMSKENSSEEYLLFAYRCFLEFQINRFNSTSKYKDKTIDELEEYYDEVISKREADKDLKIENKVNNKRWWNIFF